MADFIVPNVFSIVAACAKVYNSHPSKPIFSPSVTIWNRWSQHHKHYTGSWLHLCYQTLAGVGNLRAQIFPLFALSPHTGLSGKTQAGLLDRSGLLEKSWSHAVGKKDQLSCCLCLEHSSRKWKSFVPFSPPRVSIQAPLSLHCCYHTIWFTPAQFGRLILTTDLAVVQTGNLNWSKWVN